MAVTENVYKVKECFKKSLHLQTNPFLMTIIKYGVLWPLYKFEKNVARLIIIIFSLHDKIGLNEKKLESRIFHFSGVWH